MRWARWSYQEYMTVVNNQGRQLPTTDKGSATVGSHTAQFFRWGWGQ